MEKKRRWPRALRRRDTSPAALWLSGLALPLTVVAFWAHVPMVLAAGGAFLGWQRRQAATGSGRAVTAFALGLLAVIGYVAIIVLYALAI